ncbi:MAG: Esterase [Chthoniobacteraceae bacterium]|nr:Esterase [Chthoniobacteraceae bacterium]
MKFPQVLALVFWLPLLALHAESPAGFTRIEDVIYGRKSGVALTMDVIQPVKGSNGHGVVFMVSGGWYSSHDAVNPGAYAPFLDHGYTVFAVVHGSQPKFTITEITPDIHRAIRFIRFNAKKWGVDPDHLGISGGSAGGHLSLTMGTQGGPGKADAKDPIDRESSAVQAVGCFYPPTDFLNYGMEGEDAVGVGILKDFKAAFGARSESAESRQQLGKEISPIYFINAKLPPTLIVHGDADKLVPIQQSQSFVERATQAGAEAKLIVKTGGVHGWAHQEVEAAQLADWFDAHLLEKK